MKLPALTPRMVTVLTWIAVFAAMAPATVMTAAPTAIWLEAVAADVGPGLGRWLIHAAASLVALIGLLAYFMIWAWPLAAIFLATRAVRALRRRFPRARQTSPHKGEDAPVRGSQYTKQPNAR